MMEGFWHLDTQTQFIWFVRFLREIAKPGSNLGRTELCCNQEKKYLRPVFQSSLEAYSHRETN